MQPIIIGVRFNKNGKVYHFDSSNVPDIHLGEHVIVDTSRGKHLGEVIQFVEEPSAHPDGEWKKVERRATPRDLILRQTWHSKQAEAMITCRARATELGLSHIKVIAAEFNFDGSRLAILYSPETEDKVDLKSLRYDMQKRYPQVQVEMRQVGPRDVAKILGGIGVCGLERRCCSNFLTDFSPISIKMAKEQGISLTPSEITGMCGRLRCCLIYEYDQYVAARKELPKRNKRLVTPLGEGKVVDVLPLRNVVLVRLEADERGTIHEFDRDVLEPWDELEALRRKGEKPCEKQENDDCDCGKSDEKKQ